MVCAPRAGGDRHWRRGQRPARRPSRSWRMRHSRPLSDPAVRRCLRQYRVEAGTDLFGVWVVEISYGRIGTAGRSRSYVVRDEGEARDLARRILKRRASAPRWLGVAYRIRELIDPEGWAGASEAIGLAQSVASAGPTTSRG